MNSDEIARAVAWAEAVTSIGKGGALFLPQVARVLLALKDERDAAVQRAEALEQEIIELEAGDSI